MTFPEIVPGGSLPLAWQLKDKPVVLIGGGMVASGRLFNLLQADELVTLIAPSNQLHPEVKYRIHEDPIASSRITYLDKVYSGKQDLQGAEIVLTAIDDNEQSLRIWRDAKDLRIPINVADVPPNCDFYFGSLIRRGPLQILVSTNGKGPKLASLIRQRVEESLPENVEGAIKRVGILREKLRERAPEVGGKLGKERMKWMSGICESWNLEELAELDDQGIDKLLDEGWERRKVMGCEEFYGMRRRERRKGLKENVSPLHWFVSGLLLGGLGSWLLFRKRG